MAARTITLPANNSALDSSVVRNQLQLIENEVASASSVDPGHLHTPAGVSATGTPGATTFWRGDNTWSVPAGSGGTVTTVSVTSANGFAGTVTNPTTTPAITITTTQTGFLLGNGTSVTGVASTGSGSVVRATSPTLVTPVLGAATATTINGLALNGTGSTLTITAGKSFTVGNTLTFTGTDGSTINFGTGGAFAYTDVANAWSDGIKQTFNPNGTSAGISVGQHSADPSVAADGDLFYNTSLSALRARISGAWVTVSDAPGTGTVTSVSSANSDLTVATGTSTPVLTIVASPKTRALVSASTTVDVSAATAPTNGQVLTATSGTTATWQTPSAGSGDVVGPASATDNAVVRFDTTTGKLIQNSAVTIADTSGDITGGKYNGLTITTSTGTLTVASAKTITHNATTTFAGTDGKTLTISNSGTLGGGDAFVLAIAAAKTLTVSNTLTFTGTDASSVAFGTGGTVLYTASTIPLTVGSTTIASGTDTRILYDNAGVLGEYTLTGTGTVVAMQTNPTLSGVTITDATNIVLNTTTGTKIGTGTTQKLAFYNSTPVVQQTGDVATALSTLGLVATPTVLATTISTATESTDTTCFPVFVTASGTQTLPAKTNTTLTYNSNTNDLGVTKINGLTMTASTGTFTLTNAKTLTVSDTTTLATNAITLGGGEVITFSASNALSLLTTGTSVMTFPTATDTVVTLAASQTLTTKTLTSPTIQTSPVLAAATNLKYTVASSDGTATGDITNEFNSGYSSTAIGDLVYLDSSATWQKADADASATTYSSMLGIALSVTASGAAATVLLRGFVYAATPFPTFTIGLPIYMSATAGAVTQTAPVTTDSATRVVGYAVHADKMWFNPSNDWITHT